MTNGLPFVWPNGYGKPSTFRDKRINMRMLKRPISHAVVQSTQNGNKCQNHHWNSDDRCQTHAHSLQSPVKYSIGNSAVHCISFHLIPFQVHVDVCAAAIPLSVSHHAKGTSNGLALLPMSHGLRATRMLDGKESAMTRHCANYKQLKILSIC